MSYREHLAPIDTIMGAFVRANHVLEGIGEDCLMVLSNGRDASMRSALGNFLTSRHAINDKGEGGVAYVEAGAFEGQELALLELLACVPLVNYVAAQDSDQMTDDHLTMRLVVRSCRTA